ncbi:MAG: thioredoxin family protein [Burkholderiaceae bacterium]
MSASSLKRVLVLLLALAWSSLALAQPGPAAGAVRVEAVEVELVAEHGAARPGQPLTLGLRIAHDAGWHTYWRNPGDSGLATELALTLPEGFSAGPIQWPAPWRLFIPPLANYGYEDEIVLPLEVDVPAELPAGPVRITGKAFWLMCHELCIPGEAELALSLPVAAADAPPPASRHAALFAAARARMPTQRLPVTASMQGDRLSIGFDAALAGAEFFPYREGLIGNAAPQVLYRIDDGDERPARRLEILLSDDGRAAAVTAAGLAGAAEGVLVAGDQVFELQPVAAAASLAGGSEISRVAGAPPARGRSEGAGLLSFGQASGGPTSNSPGPAGGGWAAALGTAGAGAAAAGAAPSMAGLSGSFAGLLFAALFAAVGGLILNLMPCVFPVIGLKVLGYARHGGGDPAARRASRNGGFAFAAGVLISFWLLAGLLLALRTAGQAAGWGFQLQSPGFVAAMALLFVVIALNFSGVWEFGTSMTRLGQLEHGPAGSPRLGAFGSGVLAVLVATPCTAPFMGSALGYTLTASVAETLVVFTALGLGMALPYLLLGLFPAWLRWLPRPGRWMESFRQALAFPMYATAAWLAWVLGQQAGIDAALALAIGAILVGFAAWLYGRFVQHAGGAGAAPAAAARRRALAGGLAVLSLAVGLLVAWPQARAPVAVGDDSVAPSAGLAVADAAAWRPWSVQAVEAALAAGQPVFVDFTAAWCVSCQVNKRLVLDRDAVVDAMRDAGVLRLKADWTRRDPEITAELARHGRNGVPLYLVYASGADSPRVLPELLTAGIVLNALAGR